MQAKIRGACELSQSWEEAYARVRMAYETNALEFVDAGVSIIDVVQVAQLIIWPAIERDRRTIYLGFTFI